MSAAGGRRWSLALGGVFLLALVLRLIHLAALDGSSLVAVLLGDGRGYWAWALEIAAGDWLGDETFYQAPLYPYLLAGLIRLAGPSPLAVRLFQALLGSVSCVLLALAGRRFFDDRVGFTAGVLLAIYPAAIFFDGLIQTSLAAFFLCLLLVLLGALLSGGPVRSLPRGTLTAVGAVMAALTLTRENALLLVPVVVLWAWQRVSGPLRTRLLGTLFVLLGLAVVLAPVGLRNQAVGGRFLLTTSQLGSNFYIGNHPQADGRYRPLEPGRQDSRVERLDARRLAEADVGRRLDPAEVSDYWLDRSLDWIADRPGDWLVLTVRKLHMTVHHREVVDTEAIEAYADVSPLLRAHRLLGFGLLLPFALIGVWWTRHR